MKDSWSPDQYDKYKRERSQPFFDLMALLTIAPGGRVVDLGCGTGDLTSELHLHLKAETTLGIDSSDQMLLKTKPYQSPSLTFAKDDIQNWEQPKSFDVIFSNAALQWCTDHPRLFNQLRNSLADNGQLAVQMPMNHDYPTHVIAQDLSREPEWANRLNNYSPESPMLNPEDYAQILFDLGFKQQKVFVQVYGHTLDSRTDVIEWVKGTLLTRFQSRLSENDYVRFLAEFQDRLFKVLRNDKPFFYPFKRILIWGQL